MAVIDTLTMLLEADPTKLEEGLDKATEKSKEFKEEQEEIDKKMLENIARQEAMVSSLNQISGGFAKTTAAARELGFVNEEQEKTLNKVRFGFEMVAGPMEMYIAFSKISTVVNFAEAKSKLANASATGILTGAWNGLTAAFAANPIGMIVVGLVLLTIALIALENKLGFVTKSVELLNDIFDLLAAKLKYVTDGLKGIASVADKVGDAINFGPISGVMNVLGGR